MKKISVTLLTLFSVVLVGCNSPKREREEQNIDIDPVPSIDSDLPTLFLSKLNSYSSYKAVTSGQTVTNFLGVKINQTIDVTVIRSEYSYMLNESHSSMFNTVHTAYFHDQKVVYKDNKGDYKNSSLNDYLSIYGTFPFDAAIEGYSVSKGCLVSVNEEKMDDNRKITLEFNKETSTNNVKIQMKKMGGLDDYPKFKGNTVMEIIVKEDYTPVSLTLKAHYSAKKVFETDCKQEYTVTYSNFDEVIEVPNLDEVKPLF